MIETDNSNSPKLTQQEVIRLERDLAKFANMMDSVVRIPFTKQGVGADAALSTVPVAGDLAGFALTCYAIYKARQIGVPQSKLNPVIKLATMDAVVGFIPVAGTIFDIFIRPSRKALDIVHDHIREEYQIHTDRHVVHPFLHEKLEQKQQQSAFWRNPVVAWIWIHIPDILGTIFLILFVLAIGWGGMALYQWISQTA
ncbi:MULTISPECIES: DUF4112 domain-containing protein [Acinetobacter]|jgi:hypothetical protein|uniref:DUF4112 domain-containing protein n=2 Tax=Acinetobacter schindleri TaxID=108981 RepID=N8Z652_9GAMM|nr:MULTISPECIES: DUF4112 domain-containing protein [Acinetobacter]AWD69266.1 DUF4112 domain-containing protein [Acinetobacter schindleri]ENV44416.1 hypothetical protein F955_01204 [Acinetobacter schindleri CIP 107287]ENX00181.1 hypothetical protein F899_02369 [Acinetobacter sp. CIP 101934]MCO8066960.1 DUF4112 domain-containing protein [Acinetobacter schindleri]POU25504.1 DUF4112 domain-containing protein [Acinetobacter sp. ACNIH3]